MTQEMNIRTIRDCVLPLDLFYDTRNHLWIREEEKNILQVGLTDMAQTLAGKILYITPREKTFRKANKPLTVLEAAKWMGVIRLPFDTTINAYNTEVLDSPFTVNQFPYTRGWIVKLKVESDAWRQHFLPGDKAVELYHEKFDEWKLVDCVHCVGFEI